MPTQMIIRIDQEIKNEFQKSAQREGKSASQVMRDLMQTYVHDHDPAAYIDSLWESISNKFKTNGTKLKDVNKAIRQTRAAKA